MALTDPTPAMLCQAKCVPCEGGVPVLDAEQVSQMRAATPAWSLSEDGKFISRRWKLKSFVEGLKVVNVIGEVAETEQHHPDLHLTGYRFLAVELTTHAIGGLSENDFILAAKIDAAVETCLGK